jgi:hypothetical protein
MSHRQSLLLCCCCCCFLQEALADLQHDRMHRWSTPSHMIAICMARQPHPNKLMPLWEELAACACAVQNMHLMATSLGLAAYWSSWHEDARDSPQMLQFLGIDGAKGDRCVWSNHPEGAAGYDECVSQSFICTTKHGAPQLAVVVVCCSSCLRGKTNITL